MSSYFHMEIDKVKEELLKMSGLVEDSLDRALMAMSSGDTTLAREVIRNDQRIDDLENQIDHHCISLLATNQPVAMDLRFLTSSLRLCAVLERIGDQSVNLARRALNLDELSSLNDIPPGLADMGKIAREMVSKSLDAFVSQDLTLAREVCKQDDQMDQLNRSMYEELIAAMMGNQSMIRKCVELILAARALERIGDQATNVAEAVVFMVEGTVIRHMEDESNEN